MRTTADKVRQIMGELELTDSVIESYITAANTWINAVFSGKMLGESLMTEIETWVTAHFITVTQNRMAKKEGAGGAFIEYAGDFGEGLQSSSYGQTAILLDTSGVLASVGLKLIKIIAL